VLSLDSPRWAELKHAYGNAADIPSLLFDLTRLPRSDGKAEPWFSLWSALAHQGDVFSASFAAVPHVIEALSSDPTAADSSYFQFPAWVEICRHRRRVEIPSDLRDAYFASLKRLPVLAAVAAENEWDDGHLACVLAAIAASQGHPDVAEAALELDPDSAVEFMKWFRER
jgi:hypothetical protein